MFSSDLIFKNNNTSTKIKIGLFQACIVASKMDSSKKTMEVLLHTGKFTKGIDVQCIIY